MTEHKPTMNVQDGFFNNLRKERRLIYIYLINGKRLMGKILRFDRYALVISSRAKEILIYKHAIASVMEVEEESAGGIQTDAMD